MPADRNSIPTPATDDGAGAGLRGALFLCVFALYWITVTPFVDRSVAEPPVGALSAILNQWGALGLMAAAAALAMGSAARGVFLRPRLLLVAVLGWLAFTALLAPEPGTTLRRVVLATTIVVTAYALPLVPRDPRQFARLIGIGTLGVLALCYFGVLAMPRLAVHQVTDFAETVHAGLWRGFYIHKNFAGAVMVIASFIGLYCMSAWSRVWGLVIVVGAVCFLFGTGTRTAAAILPGIVLVAFVIEKLPAMRYLIVLGGLGGLAALTLGAALSPAIAGLLSGLGLDPTFTGRTAIWQLSLNTIAASPLTGVGFDAFWRTDALVMGGGHLESWAVTAANAHNAWLDAAIAAGLPWLLLIVLWLLIDPLRDYGRARASGNDPALTRLFLRIWLFGLGNAALESIFFQPGPIWFTFLVAVAGLRYQARAELVPAPARAATPASLATSAARA